jgi:hypothetical protein
LSRTDTPEADSPITLQSDRKLTGLPMQRNELPGPTAPRADPGGLSVATLTMAGVVAVAGVGWIMQRRSRQAQQTAAQPAPIAEEPMSESDVAPVLAPEPLPPVEATFALVLPRDAGLPPDSTLLQELALALGCEVMAIAPLPPVRQEIETEAPRRRPAAWSVELRRFLMKFLLLARTVAGGSSILAAIAIVVFWAIESIESSTRETQLNLVLLGLVLATAVGSWCCGWIANQLHRSLYNRNHPKFDD